MKCTLRPWGALISALIVLALAGCATQPKARKAAASAQATAPTAPPYLGTAESSADSLTICSFNIQFLGHFTKKDHVALADLVKNYDLVVVQELIASPATTGSTRRRAKLFFDAMASHGFAHVLSDSDTGRSGPLPNYTTATEWFVTFYKPGKVTPAADLANGFISQPLAAHPEFVRVPYAAAFRTFGGTCDFVLVSVHLEPEDEHIRAREFQAIDRWIRHQYSTTSERDLIVLGDTNLQSKAELTANTPQNFISLNADCLSTNTNPNGRPYDHVIFHPQHSSEIDRAFGFKVINLIDAMRASWTGLGAYPGDPYVHDEFRQRYSDHHPVVFRIRIPQQDDD
jgi:endonuclease/exonuclease/phosphatase family metal-dependent hydrolase